MTVPAKTRPWASIAGAGIVGLAAILAALFFVRQPAPGGDPIVDTWPIGPPRACSVDPARCDKLVQVGLAALDHRNPGHAPVASTEFHAEGVFANSAGERFFVTRSGSISVLVVKLTDGSTRAIGVGYPGIGDDAVATPWETRPSDS